MGGSGTRPSGKIPIALRSAGDEPPKSKRGGKGGIGPPRCCPSSSKMAPAMAFSCRQPSSSGSKAVESPVAGRRDPTRPCGLRSRPRGLREVSGDVFPASDLQAVHQSAVRHGQQSNHCGTPIRPGSARRQHQWSVAVPSMPAAKISKMVRGVDTSAPSRTNCSGANHRISRTVFFAKFALRSGGGGTRLPSNAKTSRTS